MQPLDIEQSTNPKSSVPSTDIEEEEDNIPLRPQHDKQAERRVEFLLFLMSLTYISIGYHLSIFNSLAIYLWEPSHELVTLFAFRNTCDFVLAVIALTTCFILCL